MSILTGVGLIVLGAIFVIIRSHISIWLALIFVLGIIDIATGLYRKNR